MSDFERSKGRTLILAIIQLVIILFVLVNANFLAGQIYLLFTLTSLVLIFAWKPLEVAIRSVVGR